ncbi:MAG: hypothetical protein LBB80_06345 [Treponema sp.]|jgi:hypothetical protein|nr:hypothetical protein [Treponema sp.]
MIKPGSPAPGLGIFFMFCLALPVFGQEASGSLGLPIDSPPAAAYALSSEGGSLWIEGERGSGFWGTVLSLNRGPLYGAIGAGGLLSNLPSFDADYTGAWFNAGLDTAPVGLDLAGGLFHRDALNAEAFGFPISSAAAGGYFLGLGLPLRFGSWSAGPSLLFAQGFWEEGDLYWFFGKPQVPAFFAAGLTAGFREEHRLYFHYLSLNLNILSPLDEKLFTAHGDGIVAAYRWSFNRKPFRLDASAGWLSVSGNMKGGLSSGNQPYFLFPYVFYHAALDASFHGLFSVLAGEYRRDFFRLNMTLGAVQALWGELNADLHAKQKKLSYLGILIFDGREEYDSWSSNLRELGAAFLLIKGGLEALPLGRNRSGPQLSVTVGKLFAIPWGYEPILSYGSSEHSGDAEGPKTSRGGLSITSILLSGLSFCCSITW